MVPRCKDQYYGKDLLFVVQALHYFLVHQPVSRFSLEHAIQILRNRGTPSLCFQQASRTVNLTEGYPCVHSRTISLQTVRRYGTSQCGQDRDEFTY